MRAVAREVCKGLPSDAVTDGLPISGISHVDLSVRDRRASARWYCDVLGFDVSGEGANAQFGIRSTVLVHPSTPVSIALIEHEANPGERFDERRCGLDHLSFELPSGFELERWARSLAERGYEVPSIGDDDGIPLLVLRDPDNIQIELYAGPLAELSASEVPQPRAELAIDGLSTG